MATLTITPISSQTPAIGQIHTLSVVSSATNWDSADDTNPLTISSDPAALGVSGTNLTVDGSNDLLVNPDGHTVTAADIGRCVQISTTGTGAAFTVGGYLITNVSTGTSSTQRWTLKSSPAATSSAGATWNLTSANLDYVLVNSSSQCIVGVYTGDLIPGAITILDTVNNASASFNVSGQITPWPVTGSTWYVGSGGCEQPGAPIPTSGYATTGSTPYMWQLIAKNANGKTAGMVPGAIAMGNVTATSSFQNQYFSNNVTVVNNWNPSSGSITFTFPLDPNAVNYDLIRSVDASNWILIGSNNSSGSITDSNSSLGSYTLPTANNTSGGSDSNSGTSAGSPFLTLGHAMTAAIAGDQIVINPSAVVVDSSAVTCKDGVSINFSSGAVCLTGVTPFSSTHAAYRMPSSANLINPNFQTTTFGEIALGCLSADTPTVDCRIYASATTGNTNAIRIGAAGCSVYIAGGIMTSEHGTLGIISSATNSVVNAERITCYARGAFQTTGGSTVACIFNNGLLCVRDSTFISNRDSQNLPSWKSNAMNPAGGKAARMINCTMFGITAELSATAQAVVLNNTIIDPVKNNLNGSGMAIINQGIYQPNPLQVPAPSSVTKGVVYAGGSLTGSAASGGGGSGSEGSPGIGI